MEIYPSGNEGKFLFCSESGLKIILNFSLVEPLINRSKCSHLSGYPIATRVRIHEWQNKVKALLKQNGTKIYSYENLPFLLKDFSSVALDVLFCVLPE